MVDNTLIKEGKKTISELIYPLCNKENFKGYEKELMKTENTQVALAAVESSLYDIAVRRGFKNDILIGHSFGELVALYADGVFDKQTLIELSMVRGECMSQCSCEEKTGMMAVFSSKDHVENIIKDFDKLYVSNDNSEVQITVSGSMEQLNKLKAILDKDEIKCTMLKISTACHSPYMKEASKRFKEKLLNSKLNVPEGNVIANVNANYYERKSESIVKNLTLHLTNTVLFRDSIIKAYEDGVRIFVEFGPKNVLSSLVSNILLDDDITIIPLNKKNDRGNIYQMELSFAKLFSLGMDISADPYRRVLDSSYKNRRNQSSYEVKPTIFHLNKKQKDIDNAFNIVHKVEIDINNKKKESCEETDMSMDNEKIFKLRELNASVFENFMNVQNEQIKCISELLEKTKAEKATDRKDIFECIRVFQENSMNAFEIYFRNQGIETVDKRVSDFKESPKHSDLFEKEDVEKLSENSIESEDEVKTDVIEECDIKADEVEKIIINIISEKTGYPEDMIEKGMALESDLGIDSIRRIEIFSEIGEKLDNIFSPDDMEELSLLDTVENVINYAKEVVK